MSPSSATLIGAATFGHVTAANGRKVRIAVARHLKMLRDARMAGLMKLHCSARL